ncbi:MAG: flagellar basal body rod protein FlgB [Rhodobacterales bacterium 32-66-7]|nr:MAG: flagellar basal body rod protein FlgB [Rhodobacterales bacterium 12-65-15]OYX24368.1 MAG: flagellar basal body rod protein FlgB [Rhodobacterales bacterium 32-66-7]OZA13951.1 MAG: flagellar basal body rod protein FlgB [Rhodobacterales bacterium 17-64-5]
MFEKLELTRMAQALAAHSGARMGVIARNIANADTPGYKAQDLPPFAKVFDDEGAMRTTRPGHLGGGGSETPMQPQTAPGREAPNGNTVSLEGEMVKSVEVRQSHEMALAVYRATSDVIRASLGRSR